MCDIHLHTNKELSRSTQRKVVAEYVFYGVFACEATQKLRERRGVGEKNVLALSAGCQSGT